MTADNIVDAFITDHVEDASVHVSETETADAIQAITVAGVEAIRAAYPDEE